MIIRVDTEQGTVTEERPDGTVVRHPMVTAEAFELLSKAWLRCGWDAKHVYSFTWLGRPIIQLPEDIIRVQEVVHRVRPTVIVETGVAHGGSLVFYAGLLKLMGGGRVIGIDIEIRPRNRAAIESHPMADAIELIEGSSVAADTLDRVRAMLKPDDRVFVMLDSCHTRAHVLAELEAYGPMVSVGSYIVASDGIMGEVVGAPRTAPDWGENNPRVAAAEFAAAHQESFSAGPDEQSWG